MLINKEASTDLVLHSGGLVRPAGGRGREEEEEEEEEKKEKCSTLVQLSIIHLTIRNHLLSSLNPWRSDH